MTLLLTYDPIGDLSKVPRPLNIPLKAGLIFRDGEFVWGLTVEGWHFRTVIKWCGSRAEYELARDRLEKVLEAARAVCARTSY